MCARACTVLHSAVSSLIFTSRSPPWRAHYVLIASYVRYISSYFSSASHPPYTGSAAFMALYMPTPSAVALVAGDDDNDDLYFDAFTHLHVRRYQSLRAELVGGCATSGGGLQALHDKAHAGRSTKVARRVDVRSGGRTSGSACTHSHKLEASRVCVFLQDTCASLSALARVTAELQAAALA